VTWNSNAQTFFLINKVLTRIT